MLTVRKLATALTFLLVTLSALSAEPGGVQSPKEATTQTDPDWIDARWSKTEIGQFLHACIDTPGKRTPKALAIKVGDREQGAICFDTDTMRYVAGWTGGFLQLHPQRYGLIQPPSLNGEIQFTTRPGPGWAKSGSFQDPRRDGLGPLPKDWAHYRGLYLSGKRVTLSYTVGAFQILDSPWLEEFDGKPEFTRSLEIRGKGEALVRLCDSTKTSIKVHCSGQHTIERGPRGAVNLRLIVEGSMRVAVRIGTGPVPRSTSLEFPVHGGPPRWLPELETAGILGKEAGPFAIDTLPLPYANPWNALFFTSGHDFLSASEAAISTIHGDVWLVTGIDDKLSKLRWKRFATGLYQPLGLKVVDGKIHVIERDQITILHDLNGDREADFYENFNNDCISGGGGHSYTTSLETDSRGNFYFSKCAENTPFGGSLLRVDPSGSRLEAIATGFRNPNGMSIGPGDLITVADQQGDWVPETRLDLITPGGFYGFMPMHKRAVPPTTFDPPLAWIPRAIDNSAGGQVWIPHGSWGELSDQLLHLSYGRCTMMLVLRDRKNGGIVPLPGRFLSGAMRGRFLGQDLFVSGMRGWQTAAIRDGAFQRVRRTEKALNAPIAFRLSTDALELTFDQPLEPSLAGDLSGYAAEQWNYKWSKEYGSPDFSLVNPGKQGRDPLELSSASLRDSRTLALRFKHPLRPVHTLKLSYNLETADGEELRGDFYCTVNKL